MFAAGLIKGLTGFGFSLLAVPVLVVLFGPRVAVPVIILLNAGANVVLFLSCRKAARKRRIVPLIIAGIAAVPIGMLLLLRLDAGTLKLIVGCITVLFALAFLMGFRRPVKNERLGFAVAGLISGALNGLISTGGPPAVLFIANQGIPKEAFRASLITYFLFLSLASIPIFVGGGLLSPTVVHYAAMLAPVLFFGTFTGSRLRHTLADRTFRNVSLLIVMVAGVLSVLSGLGLM